MDASAAGACTYIHMGAEDLPREAARLDFGVALSLAPGFRLCRAVDHLVLWAVSSTLAQPVTPRIYETELLEQDGEAFKLGPI